MQFRRCDPRTENEDVREPRTRRRGIDNFESFMEFLAPVGRGPVGDVERDGERLFLAVGCGTCHTPSLTTGPSANLLFHRVNVPLFFSDLLLDEVGTGDGIEEGAAATNEIRSLALWGLRLRRPLLHDGSAATIADAIQRHRGEAGLAQEGYLRLSPEKQWSLLAFLRSLRLTQRVFDEHPRCTYTYGRCSEPLQRSSRVRCWRPPGRPRLRTCTSMQAIGTRSTSTAWPRIRTRLPPPAPSPTPAITRITTPARICQRPERGWRAANLARTPCPSHRHAWRRRPITGWRVSPSLRSSLHLLHAPGIACCDSTFACIVPLASQTPHSAPRLRYTSPEPSASTGSLPVGNS